MLDPIPKTEAISDNKPKGAMNGLAKDVSPSTPETTSSTTSSSETATTSSSELSEEERKRLERLERAQKMKLALQVIKDREFCIQFIS